MFADVYAFDVRHGFRILLDVYSFVLSLLLGQRLPGAPAIQALVGAVTGDVRLVDILSSDND